MTATIHVGDALSILRTMPEESVNCCVTSPPYWGLRDYGVDGQIGLGETFDEFIERLVAVFDEVRRVLRADGVAWVNMGDSYCQARPGGDTYSGANSRMGRSAGRNGKQAKVCGAFPAAAIRSVPGLKPKDLIGQPWRLAFALQSAGWWLRSDCIWHKPNPMPESVTDRPTKSHEYVFLLTKSARYFYDAEAVRQPSSANLRTVWTIPTQPFSGAHFATFPEALAERCILAGCPQDGTVLDPFTGSGTTGAVAVRSRRSFVGCELNPEYAEMARRRIGEAMPLFVRPTVVYGGKP